MRPDDRTYDMLFGTSKTSSSTYRPSAPNSSRFGAFYVKKYPFYYREKKLVIVSFIDLRVLLRSSIFEVLIELKLLDSSHIAEIPD
jgi:hypothetical protein